MAIKAVIENLEDIPEVLREDYVENDGKYVLKVEGMDLEENFIGLKTSYNNIKNEKKELESKYKMYKQFGDLEEIKTKLSEYETLKSNPKMEDVDKVINERVESIKQQLTQKHQEQYSQLEESFKALQSNFRLTKIENAVKTAINITDAYSKSASAVLKSVIDMDDEGNIYVKGDDGQPLLNNKGENINPTEYLESLKSVEEFKGIFRSSSASGSGILGSRTKNNGQIVISRSDPNYPQLMVNHAMDMKDGRVKIVD